MIMSNTHITHIYYINNNNNKFRSLKRTAKQAYIMAHVPKDCVDHTGTIECIRQYGLKENIRIRDLSHLSLANLSGKQFNALIKPSFTQITWLLIPSNQRFPYHIEPEPTLEERRIGQSTAFVMFGTSLRRLPFSAISERMLNTMRENSVQCCMCWEAIQRSEDKPANLCVDCNVTWCHDCQTTLEGKINTTTLLIESH